LDVSKLLQGEDEGISQDLAQGIRVRLGDGLQSTEDEGCEVFGLCGHGGGELGGGWRRHGWRGRRGRHRWRRGLRTRFRR